MSRRFCKIRPSFWHSPKVLDMDAQERLLAIYLMTNPSFQMVGIYHIPKVLMSAHTGLNEESIEECLASLEDLEFLQYDHDRQVVWVVDMALSQIADNPNTNQLKGAKNELARLWEEEMPFVEDWLERHKRFGFSIAVLEGADE